MAYNTADRRPIVVVEAPAHPVQQLQGPFEESMFESQNGSVEEIEIPLDATTRRTMLLEASTYQRVIAGRWKQKFGEKYHPLWKLVAQMSFGIHLLAEGMAKSEEDVFQILQTHVDDIDVFLERTTEDFTLAQEDIQERLKCLKLPLQHPEVFDRMLEDRTFRSSIVEGNEKIEHIVTRTGCGMKDALKDIQKGYESTSALERYLQDLEVSWVRTTPEHEAVFVAMLGNVEGWKRAFLDLHMQGNKLAGSLKKLTEVINQMQQRAGEVSRKLVRQQQRQGGSIHSSSSITYISQQDQSSRSSSRQQATPSPLGFKKPLPAPTSRASTRQQSRADSRNDPYSSRSGTSQSQRSGTSQSQRSGDTRSETPGSRAQSRNDHAPDGTAEDTRGNTRMNIGTPRVIYVKNHTGHHRANSQSASVRQYTAQPQPILEEVGGATPTDENGFLQNTPKMQTQLRAGTDPKAEQAQIVINETRPSIPVELPAELPPSVFLQAPMSKINRLSIGLGILPSERRAQAQSKGFNPTTALIELLSDPSRYSKLPVTPSSAVSPDATLAMAESQRHFAGQLQQAAMREPTPDQTPPKFGESASNESTPSTPAWATQTFDAIGRVQQMADKIPTQSYTPSQTPENTSGNVPTVSVVPSVSNNGTSVNELTEKSGASKSCPDTMPMQHAPQELSAGYENEMPRLAENVASDATTLVDSPEKKAVRKKKLSYVAELEGSVPVFLPSTVYTPISFGPIQLTAHELEAPQTHFNLPPRTSAIGVSSAGVSEPSTSANFEGPATTMPNDPSTGADGRNGTQLEAGTSSPIAKIEPIQSKSEDVETNDSDVDQKLSELPLVNRMSAKIETAFDMVHLPSVTPAGSPTVSHLDTRPHSAASRNSAMLEHRRITTINTAKPPNDHVHLILQESVNNATESTQDGNVQLPIQQLQDERFTAPRSPTVIRPTSERPKSPFPLTVNTTSSKDTSVNAHNDSPRTPASIDLKRSNTKESRSQWKAFFTGQLKSPSGSARSTTSTASVGQPSPKHKPAATATFETVSPNTQVRQQQDSAVEHDPTLVSFLASPSPDDADEDPVAKHQASKAEMAQEPRSLVTPQKSSYEQHDILNDYV